MHLLIPLAPTDADSSCVGHTRRLETGITGKIGTFYHFLVFKFKLMLAGL